MIKYLPFFVFCGTLMAGGIQFGEKNAWGAPPYENIVIDHDYAYMATYSGVDIIDTSQPMNPVGIASVSLGYATDIAISGDILAVAGSYLAILDVSDRFNPILLYREELIQSKNDHRW